MQFLINWILNLVIGSTNPNFIPNCAKKASPAIKANSFPDNFNKSRTYSSKPPLFSVRKSHAKIALFQKCALSDYWEEDDLDSFLKFLVHTKLTKYMSRIFELLNQKQFAILLYEFEKDLTSENFQVFENKWNDKMWESCRLFLDETHEIFSTLKNC